MEEPSNVLSTQTKRKAAFLSDLFRFHSWNGTPIKRIPMLGGRELDLYHLFTKVKSLGGSKHVQDSRQWGEVARSFSLPSSVTSASYAVRQHYIKLLEKYERYEADPLSYEQYSPPAGSVTRPPSTSSPWRSLILNPLSSRDNPLLQMVLPLPSISQDTTDLDSVTVSKLVRSLQSGLPNEVDFAFNVLTIMSFERAEFLCLHKLPHLLAVMLAHVAVFSEDDPGLESVYHECWHKDTIADYIQFWELTVPEWIFTPVLNTPFSKASYCSSLFNPHILSDDDHVESYRVCQLANILRNLSFLENCAHCFATSGAVLRFLILSVNNRLPSIKSLSLDILANIAPYTSLTSLTTPTCLLTTPTDHTSDLLLGTICDCLFSEDKLSVIRGLETLGELSQSPANIPRLVTTPSEIYQRLFQLLLLSDCQLILTCLDSLYNLSSSIEMARKILAVDRSCEVLVDLLTLRTEEYSSEVMSRVKVVENRTTLRGNRTAQSNMPLSFPKTRNTTSFKGQGSSSLSALATSVSQFPFRKQGQSSFKSPLKSSDIGKGESKLLKIGNSLIPTYQSTSKLQEQLSSSPLSRALTTLRGQKVIPVLTIQQLQDLLVKNVPGMPRLGGVSQSVSTTSLCLPPATPTTTLGLPPATPTVAGSNVRVSVLKDVDRSSVNTKVADTPGQSSLKTGVISLQPQVSVADTSSRASTPDSYSSTSSLITGATPQRGTTPISLPSVKSSSPTPANISISSSPQSVSMIPTCPSITSSPRSGTKSVWSSIDTEEFTKQWLSSCYEEASGCYVSPIEMYSLYVMACTEKRLTKVLALNDFNNCVRNVFPSSLFTKITVAGTIVYMVAGLAKKTTTTSANSARDSIVTFVPQGQGESAKLGQSVKLNGGRGPIASSVTSQTGLTRIGLTNSQAGTRLTSSETRLTSSPTGLTSTVSSGNTTKQMIPVSSEIVGVAPPEKVSVYSSHKVGVSSSHDVGVSCKSIGVQATTRALQSATPTQTTPIKSSVQSSSIQLVSRASSPLFVSRKAIDVTSFETPLPIEVKGQQLAVDNHNSIRLVSGLPLKSVTRECSPADDIPPAKRIRLDNCLHGEGGDETIAMASRNHVDETMIVPLMKSHSDVSNGPPMDGCWLPVALDGDENNAMSHDREAVKESNAISHDSEGVVKESSTMSHDSDAVVTKSNAMSHDSEAVLKESNAMSHDSEAVVKESNCLGNDSRVLDDAMDVTTMENNGKSSPPGKHPLTDRQTLGTNIVTRTDSASQSNIEHTSVQRTTTNTEHTSGPITTANTDHIVKTPLRINNHNTPPTNTVRSVDGHTCTTLSSVNASSAENNSNNTSTVSTTSSEASIITGATPTHSSPSTTTSSPSITVSTNKTHTASRSEASIITGATPTHSSPSTTTSSPSIAVSTNKSHTASLLNSSEVPLIAGATPTHSSPSATTSITVSTNKTRLLTSSEVPLIAGATPTSRTPDSPKTGTPLTTPSNSTDTSPSSKVFVQSDPSTDISPSSRVSVQSDRSTDVNPSLKVSFQSDPSTDISASSRVSVQSDPSNTIPIRTGTDVVGPVVDRGTTTKSTVAVNASTNGLSKVNGVTKTGMSPNTLSFGRGNDLSGTMLGQSSKVKQSSSGVNGDGTRPICLWSNCTRVCDNWTALFHHVVYTHLYPSLKSHCQWQGCSSKAKRMRPSMIRHVQVHHCSSEAPPPTANIPQTLARIRHNPPLANESENSLTKAIHLTAALVLRNLTKTLPEAKRRLLPYEKQLCQVAMSTSEASTAIAQCLHHIHNHQLS